MPVLHQTFCSIVSKLGLCILSFGFTLSCSGQNVDWKQVWENDIQSAAKTDSAKVWDLVKWISDEVAYETNTKYHKNLSNISRPVAENAYLHGQAVCIGYAKLFEKLCTAARIPAITVEGIAYNNTDESLENHAWNLVFYAGKWRVVDPTWASGSIENGRYKSNFKKQYVDLPLEKREFSHYPYDPLLQQRKTPISFADFKNQKDIEHPEYRWTQEQIDSLLFHYPGFNDTTSLQRSMAYKPDDAFLQQMLADSYMQAAEKRIEECIQIYSRGPTRDELRYCQPAIRKTENLLLKSQELYKKVKAERRQTRSSTDINMDNITRNLNTLEKMKSFTP